VVVPKNQNRKGATTILINTRSVNLGATGLPTVASSPLAAPAATQMSSPVFLGTVSFDFNTKPALVRANKEASLINLMLGSLEFNAQNYDFRELSGARTQFKGFGKINNEAGYKYLLTVVDGQAPKGGGVDKFRIKIWNDKTGEVVFDNQMGDADDADPTTPIGDGKSISFPR
jgi:hypothetical protein